MIIDSNITYDWLITTFASLLKQKIDNFDSAKVNQMPNCFKAGYNTRVLIPESTWHQINDKHRAGVRDYYPARDCSIISNDVIPFNCITHVQSSVFDNVYNLWLTAIGLEPIRNTKVSSNGLCAFINKVLDFCNRYISIYASMFSVNTYVIFNDTGYRFPTQSWVEEGNVITAVDSEIFNFDTLVSEMIATSSCYTIQYDYHSVNAYDESIPYEDDTVPTEIQLPSEWGKILSAGIAATPGHSIGNGKYADGDGKQLAIKCLCIITDRGGVAIPFTGADDINTPIPTENQILTASFVESQKYTSEFNSGVYNRRTEYGPVDTYIPAIAVNRTGSYAGIGLRIQDNIPARSVTKMTLNMWGWRGGNYTLTVNNYKLTVESNILTIKFKNLTMMKIIS